MTLRVVGGGEPREWLTKQQVADRLQCSTRSVDRYRRDHGLPFVKRAGIVRFHSEEIEAWIREGRASTVAA